MTGLLFDGLWFSLALVISAEASFLEKCCIRGIHKSVIWD